MARVIKAPIQRAGAQRQNNNVGVAPTAAQKLIQIAKKLNLPGIEGMQGSTLTIFDTVLLSTNTGRQTLNFFQNTQNKSANFSNFQTGNLKAGEAMIIEEFTLLVLTLSGTDLTSDATAITAVRPITQVPATVIANPCFVTGQFSVNIANQVVQKNVIGIETDPAFNSKTSGIATLDTATATNTRIGNGKIYLESGPVLPPNQSLLIPYSIGPTGTVAANTAVMLVAGRFGSIFASKTTL